MDPVIAPWCETLSMDSWNLVEFLWRGRDADAASLAHFDEDGTARTPPSSILWTMAEECRPADPKRFAYIGHRGSLAHHRLDRFRFRSSDDFWAPSNSPSLTGGSQTSVHPLANNLSFKLRQCPEHMEDQPTARTGGVNLFSERPQSHAASLKLCHERDQVGQASPEAVKPPSHQHITLPQEPQCLIKPRTISRCARHGV